MQKITNKELGRKSIDEFKSSLKTPIVIVLDNVRSAHNVGSVFRTADAFLIEAIYLCGITATPPNREILKTALGSSETVLWKYFSKTTDAIKELKENSFLICSVEQATRSIMLNDFKVTSYQKIALVFGHEVDGVNQQIVSASDICIEIPQQGTKHSLNIAVASGIVVWDLFSKMKLQTKI